MRSLVVRWRDDGNFHEDLEAEWLQIGKNLF
jgi:hypothetical protein